MHPETQSTTIPARAADGTERLVTLTREPSGRISIIAEVCLCVLNYDPAQLLLAIRTLAEESGGGKAESEKAKIGKLRAALAVFEDSTEDVVLVGDLRDEVVAFAKILVTGIESLDRAAPRKS